jgi:oligopeptide/dipeptide ABC transporter ATP-binding protein
VRSVTTVGCKGFYAIMMNDKKKPILELENLRKIYRTKRALFGNSGNDVIALNRISFKIFEGEIFGLVGESGSGKTTAGRLIVRLEEPAEGKIYLENVDITGLKGKALRDFRRKVQMIFQDPYQSLNPQLSVLNTVSEPLTVHKIGKGKARQVLVRQAMKSVGLSPPDDYLHRYPHQLSGGQRQRVAIARAIVLNPRFVVADEPTSMLDASISAQIFNILTEMREKLDLTILFITHSLAAARYLCDRIAVIYRGHLMEMGPAEEVIRDPKHPYTQALIDALPKFGDCGDIKHYGTLLLADSEAPETAGCPFYPRCRVALRIKCTTGMPRLEEISDSHLVACHYALPGSEIVTEGDACFYAT